MFDLIGQGFWELFMQPTAIIIAVLGVAVGIVIGALPGLTATMGVALLLPLTFGMDPVGALLLLSGVYFGGVYGGSITAILLRTPGTPAAAATALDGYALTQQGMGSKALSVAVISASIGGFFSVIVLMLLSPVLAQFALKFSAPESFALAVFGLCIVASISGRSLLKGLIAGIAGLIIATIGLDPIQGFPRFTGGVTEMINGISFIPIMIGLFAAAEAFKSLEEMDSVKKIKVKIKGLGVTKKDMKTIGPTVARSSVLGTTIGIVPGAGGDIAAFVAYNEAKRFNADKEGFGKGKLEGVAAAESAGNACTGGALVPLLTLGIPGDSVTAVMLGALMVQGIQPGPMLFQNNGELIYTIFAGMLICYLAMLVIGLFLSRYFVKVVEIPKAILTPAILMLCVIGAYAINNSMFDVIVMLIAGIVGYYMQRYDFPASPVVLALILGPMAESMFRRSLSLSNGNYDVFYTRPITMTLLILAALTLFIPIIKSIISILKENKKTFV
ncbi:TTT family tricarboxylate transporter, membrane protein [Sporosarcina newyorkensis 2681]|uniref:TTT family tricarboxylate transporter, membrane protein n=1 Tax=Sporosarcina newyorkensis 2681 TaxID=1027292 RepID=F9DRR1_9BACL|nr:tripartite tricarboxylate transporter permease [Sporosarcina newyorkensis]EGQ26564.1 TTT family tricarboxylate transporter, membrane protein [Sporosarcina newyorkensis 2681]